jgi:hypothetical protein
MGMESDPSVRVQQRPRAAKAAQVLLGLVIGPLITYFPFWFLPFNLASAASAVCGLGIAVAKRSWRAFGIAWATGVVLYAAFMLYLFSALSRDLPP